MDVDRPVIPSFRTSMFLPSFPLDFSFTVKTRVEAILAWMVNDHQPHEVLLVQPVPGSHFAGGNLVRRSIMSLVGKGASGSNDAPSLVQALDLRAMWRDLSGAVWR